MKICYVNSIFLSLKRKAMFFIFFYQVFYHVFHFFNLSSISVCSSSASSIDKFSSYISLKNTVGNDYLLKS